MEFIEELLYKFISDANTVGKLKEPTIKFIEGESQPTQLLYLALAESSLDTLRANQIFPDFLNKVLIGNLKKRGSIIEESKEGRTIVYELNENTKIRLNTNFQNFLNQNNDYKNYLMEKRTKKVEGTNYTDQTKEILKFLISAGLRPNFENVFEIDFKELTSGEYFPIEAVDYMLENWTNTLRILKENYKNDIENISDENFQVIRCNPTDFVDIPRVVRDSKALIYTKGMVSSKKDNIGSHIVEYRYTCLSERCQYYDSNLVTDSELEFNKDKHMIQCPACKQKIELLSTKEINQLESKIIDIDSGIGIPLFIRGELASKFSYIGLGDEVEVYGHFEDFIVKKVGQGKQKIKVLVVNNFKKIDLARTLTEEEIAETESYLKTIDNLEEFWLKPFTNYIGDEELKKLLVLQQLTRYKPDINEHPIHLSIMGEAGVGKNQFIKTAQEYFPNCNNVTGADITDAGFKGTVNRDTGIKEVGLAKQTQGGLIWLNEFDKFIKTNPNGKKGGSQLLNGTMTEQEVLLNKAGIRIHFQNLDLRHNVVFNPLDETRNKEAIPYDKMAEIMDKSLLSRMIPIYIGRDNERSKKVFKVMLQPKSIKIDIDPKKYQNTILYFRAKSINLTQKAQEKLEKIFIDLTMNDKHNVVSIERIGLVLIQLTKSIGKLKNKIECCIEEVKEAYSLYLYALGTVGVNLNNLDKLFMDKTIEELETEKEMEIFILGKFDIEGKKEVEISSLDKVKDKDLLFRAIQKLKTNQILYESRKGILRRLD